MNKDVAGEITERKHREKDEDIDYNIQQISEVGDLSPRHITSLKNNAKKGRSVIPLQMKTWWSREKISTSEQ